MVAYEKIHTLKNPANFGSWVTSIAAHKAVSLLTKNKKHVPIEEVAIDYLDNQNRNRTDLADELISKELTNEVKEAVAQLKPELKKIVVLKYYLALQDREIGEYLGKPVGTVKSTLYRAKKYLAKTLSSRPDFHSLQKGCEDVDNAQ